MKKILSIALIAVVAVTLVTLYKKNPDDAKFIKEPDTITWNNIAYSNANMVVSADIVGESLGIIVRPGTVIEDKYSDVEIAYSSVITPETEFYEISNHPEMIAINNGTAYMAYKLTVQ